MWLLAKLQYKTSNSTYRSTRSKHPSKPDSMALLCPDPASVKTFTQVPENQPNVWKPGQLNNEQLRSYFEKGFVIIPDFFDKEKELDPIKKDIDKLVDGLAQRLFEAGRVKDLYQNYDIYKRFTKLEADYPGAIILLVKYGRLLPNVRTLWSSNRLLNIMEQLLGTNDIQGHPVWNLRNKTPKNDVTTVPWHQDVAYLDVNSYSVMQPAAWIPLLDTNRKNGCMEVISGGHHTARVAAHKGCFADTWYVMLDEAEMEKNLDVNVKRDTVLCEVPYGGMLLLNNLVPHRSLENLSDDIRWSIDLRWQRSDQPVCFHGLKKGVQMRSSKGPIEIDWEGFDGHDVNDPECIKFDSAIDINDTVVVGPWMKRWPIVHRNKHTDGLKNEEKNQLSWH